MTSYTSKNVGSCSSQPPGSGALVKYARSCTKDARGNATRNEKSEMILPLQDCWSVRHLFSMYNSCPLHKVMVMAGVAPLWQWLQLCGWTHFAISTTKYTSKFYRNTAVAINLNVKFLTPSKIQLRRNLSLVLQCWVFKLQTFGPRILQWWVIVPMPCFNTIECKIGAFNLIKFSIQCNQRDNKQD